MQGVWQLNSPLKVDVAIIGAGMAGAAAAVVLSRAGHRVALIDRNSSYPDEFRAEKLTGPQIPLLRQLDLLQCIAESAAYYDAVVSAGLGRIIDRKRIPSYGLSYQAMVTAVRGQLPKGVEFIVGTVTKLETGPAVQIVSLHDDRSIKARLVIIATGLNTTLIAQSGIGYRVAHKAHTACFGFSIAPSATRRAEFSSLTYYGERASDRIDYVSFFPMGHKLRANLFSYHDLHDDWVAEMRESPQRALFSTLPRLHRLLGDFEIVDRLKVRTVDIRFAENYRIPGVALIGDAFQTSCPSAGTGVLRALTDVDRLCGTYVPQWLRTPGMSAEKICQFYDDTEKRACDVHCYGLARYRRALKLDPGLNWALRRQLMYPVRRAKDFLRWNAPMLLPSGE